jgi:hypothetical protein
MHHFNGTTRKTERHRPQRTGSRPIDELVDGGDFEAANGGNVG